MKQSERYARIAEFVQDRLGSMAEEYPSEWHDPVYRWEHTLRVAHYGEQIARAETADVDVVVAGCLLHDVAHFDPMDDYKDHGRQGARRGALQYLMARHLRRWHPEVGMPPPATPA